MTIRRVGSTWPDESLQHQRGARPSEGITDELTDYTLEWLEEERDPERPFFVYLSLRPSRELRTGRAAPDQYSEADIPIPPARRTRRGYRGKPMWVENQRNNWHGVDFPYHSELDVREYKRQYHRALSAVDDSLGRILAWLEENGHADDTAVFLMGDNGFLFGEHGLIDKRNAYEESMRVPLIARLPGGRQPCRRGGGRESGHRADDARSRRCRGDAAAVRRASLLPRLSAKTSRNGGRASCTVLLGVQLPVHADDLRRPNRPVQADSIPRSLGYRRAL